MVESDAGDMDHVDACPRSIVYVPYASDPLTFFDQRALDHRPEWMAEPRGPDVSPALRWYPVVTRLQLAVELAGKP